MWAYLEAFPVVEGREIILHTSYYNPLHTYLLYDVGNCDKQTILLGQNNFCPVNAGTRLQVDDHQRVPSVREERCVLCKLLCD